MKKKKTKQKTKQNKTKYKIRHRAVILYLDLKSKTPKQVYQDMEATFKEDAPSYSMVKKWAGKFKLGRKSLEYNPRPGRPHNTQLC